jgi:uncharacterized protein YndB with AHSA1/START domain
MNVPNEPIDLVVTRTLPVPPPVVFAAWTDAAQLAQWWGTPDFPGTAAEIDLQFGGLWRACMSSPEGEDHWAGGVFRTIDPPRQLALSFAWESYPTSISEISITFAPVAAGTEMTFHQRLNVGPETAARYEEGWVDTFDRLLTHFGALRAT